VSRVARNRSVKSNVSRVKSPDSSWNVGVLESPVSYKLTPPPITRDRSIVVYPRIHGGCWIICHRLLRENLRRASREGYHCEDGEFGIQINFLLFYKVQNLFIKVQKRFQSIKIVSISLTFDDFKPFIATDCDRNFRIERLWIDKVMSTMFFKLSNQKQEINSYTGLSGLSRLAVINVRRTTCTQRQQRFRPRCKTKIKVLIKD